MDPPLQRSPQPGASQRGGTIILTRTNAGILKEVVKVSLCHSKFGWKKSVAIVSKTTIHGLLGGLKEIVVVYLDPDPSPYRYKKGMLDFETRTLKIW